MRFWGAKDKVPKPNNKNNKKIFRINSRAQYYAAVHSNTTLAKIVVKMLEGVFQEIPITSGLITAIFSIIYEAWC